MDLVALSTSSVRTSSFFSRADCGGVCTCFKGLADEELELEELDDELDVVGKTVGSSWVISVSTAAWCGCSRFVDGFLIRGCRCAFSRALNSTAAGCNSSIVNLWDVSVLSSEWMNASSKYWSRLFCFSAMYLLMNSVRCDWMLRRKPCQLVCSWALKAFVASTSKSEDQGWELRMTLRFWLTVEAAALFS